MSFVVDASMAIAWISAEEHSSAAREVAGSISRGNRAYAPALWWLEVANIVALFVRRGQFTSDEASGALASLARLRIICDGETQQAAWGATFELASRHRLTAYDAAYLELAARRHMPLATLDRALAKAAQAERVPVLGPLSAPS